MKCFFSLRTQKIFSKKKKILMHWSTFPAKSLQNWNKHRDPDREETKTFEQSFFGVRERGRETFYVKNREVLDTNNNYYQIGILD